VTREDLDSFWALDERRRELQRQDDALEREAKPLKERFLAHVRAKGGDARAVVTCGFCLAIKLADGSVRWKDEFVKLAGADAAAELQGAVPQRESLSVTLVK
jgi:hypothetical protein